MNKKEQISLNKTLKLLTESTIDGVLVISQKNGKIIHANKKIEELLKYKQSELKKKKLDHLFKPKDFKIMMERYRKRQKGYRIQKRYETVVPRKDKKTIPVELSAISIVWNKTPTVMLTVRDLSNLKKIEKDLKESEKKFKTAFEYAQDAIFWIDKTTNKIVNCNKAATRLANRSKRQLLNKHHKILYPKSKRKKFINLFDKNLKEKGAINAEIEIKRPKKRKKIVRVIASEIDFGDKKINQGIFHDITERRLAKKKIIELFRYLGIINRRLTILLEMSKKVSDCGGKAALNEITRSAKNMSQINNCLFYKLDEKRKCFKLISSCKEIPLKSKKDISCLFFKDYPIFKQLQRYRKRIQIDKITKKVEKLAIDKKTKTILILGLKEEKVLKGFLMLSFDRKEDLTTQELEFYDVFALHASLMLRKFNE